MPIRYAFLDTDIGPDCDDAAAVAILLNECRRMGIKILGITHCTGSPFGLPAIDAICRRFGTSVPLGTSNRKDFLADGPALQYTSVIAERCPHGYPPEKEQQRALETFCRGLSQAPEKSVVLISIGPLNNIADFLNDPEGRRLMLSRVIKIVSMAGSFEGEDGHVEWNVAMDVPAARALTESWPGRLDFCPSEVFTDVQTGKCLAAYPDNPVTIAYRIHTNGTMLRSSWDPGTVLAALHDGVEACEWSQNGTIRVDSRGKTTLLPSPGGLHRYLRRTGAIDGAQAQIEKKLSLALGAMEKYHET